MKFTYPSGSKPLDGYTIKRGIGIGGFGEVYFATSDAGKELALKRVQRHLDIELRGVTQCLNLKHVNLIALFDIKYDGDGEAWVIMEYIPGLSLKEIIEGHPDGLPIEEVEHWFRGILAGVAYLHDHGIVHRDLKPGNIFDDNGLVKIGDYGLSKFISCSRRSGQTESVGTFHYMAPEIGKGVYGKEIDIYALGIVLHELLTGRVPFDGETSQEIIMKHLTADPDLSAIREPYAGVIRKALAKDPARRFASVEQMIAALGKGPAQPVSPQETVVFTSCPMPEWTPWNEQPANSARLVIEDEPEGPVDGGQADMRFGPLRQHAVPKDAVPQRATSADRHSQSSAAGAMPYASENHASDEPISRAVRSGWRKFNASFEQSRQGSILKIGVLAVISLILLANGESFFPFLTTLVTLYLIYYGIRLLTLGKRPSWRISPRPMTRRQLLEQAQVACREKPIRSRCAELLGSLLAAAAACAALSALVMLLAGQSPNVTLPSLTFFAWLSIVTTCASWLLLTSGKSWEGLPAESSSRRVTMIIIGVTVGLIAYALSWFLQVDTNDFATRPHFDPLQPRGWYDADGTPRLPAFLAYFVALFAVPRWWRFVDPLRRNRVSVFSAFMVAAWAWAVHMMVDFTWPVGIMASVVIVLSTQFASTWVDWQHVQPPHVPHQRRAA